MDASPGWWTSLLDYWHQLREGIRDNIIGALVVAILFSAVAIFRNALTRLFRRLFRRRLPIVQPVQATPVQPPTQHEVLIKVESAQLALPEPHLTSQPEPSAPSTQAVAPQIPRAPAVGFVTRRDTEGNDILARLKVELAPSNGGLIALWGPGGTGKTTLAAQVARELWPAFLQRLVWVRAHARTDFTLPTLLDDIAAQLGREDLHKLRLEEKGPQVAALLANVPALVVLDTFETVAPPEQARCFDFLAECAACSALVATRDDTRRGDVRSIALAAMSPDEAQEFLRRLIGLTRQPENFAGLEDALIAQCEANPLVLQWVVKQIDLAHQPQTVLDDLAHGKGDAAERVFTRSFNLSQVGDDGRAALLALSLFVPNATRAALSEVAGFGADLPRLEQAIEQLSALWLVETKDGNKRLFLRGLTRQLAQARLKLDARADEYRRRFVAYFLSYAELRNHQTKEDYKALEAEKDNLLAAMDMAEAQNDWKSVTRLAWVLTLDERGMLNVCGYWDEAIRRGEQGARAAEAAGDEDEAVRLTGDAAMLHRWRGEYEAARRAYDRALAVSRQRGDEGNVAAFLRQLGIIAYAQGDYAEARQLYGESLEIAKKIGSQSNIARSLHHFGLLAQKQGELGEARRFYNESLEIKTTLGDQRGIASTLRELGRLTQTQGEFGKARRLYGESIAINRKLGDQRGIADCLRELGLLAKIEGDREEAARLLQEALRIYEQLRSPEAEMVRRFLERLENESS